ncbi:hypothetical protein BGX30_002162 [Mortierella sp. GBA39]|nr:hypothetical protein BGX30_002162 [Mortierella sp. GBA39]
MAGKRKDQIIQALKELEKQGFISWENKSSVEYVVILRAWENGAAPTRSPNVSRGADYWTISRMMLPQHKEEILKHQHELNRNNKPVIDEQEWQLIGEVLSASFNQHVRVTLELFDPFETKTVSGFVTVINTYRKEIKLCHDDEWEWINFGDIIAATT